MEARSIEMLEQAILPDCFYRTEPVETIRRRDVPNFVHADEKGLLLPH